MNDHPIECPWCGRTVVLQGSICPECRHEVLPEHLDTGLEPSGDEADEAAVRQADASEDSGDWDREGGESLEDFVCRRFRCRDCGGNEAEATEVAMTGTGLSKLIDLQHHHYLFVSCQGCGLVKVYDPDVLRGKKSGEGSTIADLFFG
ncbi:zinc ribbon domain-containing protein [Paenibacillus sp. FSL W8-1187]|uniref:Uncharacterized protein n=1 Tax=Paenibacillus pasadenensis TaxID=217090 RepID=A0A2N5N6I3_9BACL|nr:MULTISPECIES: zinc ribbon domain-containing protein [Paenibacillus]PLT45961.1 hypothetical protein B8V81_4392 [Paenibacillus pasadenensis]QGG56375.1 hypothetical protein GE073_12825 [Paenibacillus sp. B01]